MRKSMNRSGSFGIQISRRTREMAEISTAQAADGSIHEASPQNDPTPKSAEDKGSETSAPNRKPRKGSPITTKVKEPETGHQGRVKTKWDNDSADPNKRLSIAESPNGEGNEIAEDDDED
jgi:hypothetical protein